MKLWEDLLLTFLLPLLLKSARSSPWTDSHPDYVVSKKTPEIHPNSFYYPSSHNHGIVETCGNYSKGNKSWGKPHLQLPWLSDERVNPNGLVSVPRSGQIYALYVYVEDHRFNTDGTLSRTVFVKVSLAGCDFRPSHPKVLPCFGHTCWMVWILFNFQLLVVDSWKGDAIFVKFSQNRQSWAWFEKKHCNFVNLLGICLCQRFSLETILGTRAS